MLTDYVAVGCTFLLTCSTLAQCPAMTEHDETVQWSSPIDWCTTPREKISQPGIGIGFTGLCVTDDSVPDPHMAAGPTSLIAVVNGAIGFFDKLGNPLFLSKFLGPTGFWTITGVTGQLVDPRVIYDPASGRFFVSVSEQVVQPARAFLLLAVSDTSNPCGTWHKYRIEVTALAGSLSDQPHLGADSTSVYLSGFRSGASGPNYLVLVIQKAPLLTGQVPTACTSVMFTTTGQTAGLVPIANDNPPATYFISDAGIYGGANVQFIALRDPLSATQFNTTLVALNQVVPPCHFFPNEVVPQKGSNALVSIASVGGYFLSVSYRAGSLWAIHQQFVDNSRALARWYEFDMNDWPVLPGHEPILVQQGRIDPTPITQTVHTFFPAICTNQSGDVAVVANASADDQYLSILTSYRLHSDPSGTLHVPARRKVSLSGWNPSGIPTCERLGDYAAVVDDPDCQRFWAHQAYVVGPSEWRTWIMEIPVSCSNQALAAATLGPCDLDGNAVVTIDDLAVVLYSWFSGYGADLDGDCLITSSDLDAILEAWNPAITGTSEPGT